ncbi:hypothetical protein [Fontivita pretiosa]|uniref:hypothetical protein n=1 Tax=Fontivita pretiosa TaxID=2989684 RepID=UPI003D16E9B7
MNPNAARSVWVVYFVGFDDTLDDENSRVVPYVGKERVRTTADPQQAWHDVRLAVLARGGHLLTIIGSEAEAEAFRVAAEAEILRKHGS